MAISYNKLWKLLVDKKMSKADLRKAAGIAPNTMTRLRREAGEREVVLTVHVDLVVAGDQQQRGYGHSGRKCEIDHLVHKLYI